MKVLRCFFSKDLSSSIVLLIITVTIIEIAVIKKATEAMCGFYTFNFKHFNQTTGVLPASIAENEVASPLQYLKSKPGSKILRLSGHIKQDQLLEGDVFVEGDIIVARGVTLTIAAGSRIIIDNRKNTQRSGEDPAKTEFTVLGRLIAKGTQNKKITFVVDSPTPPKYSWYGIVLKNPQENSILRYCVIEYAYKGIVCYGSSPEILDCTVRFHQYAGISCEVRATPYIRNTKIFGNDFAGINCELESQPIVEKCIITQNPYGIIVFDKSNPDLGTLNARRGQSIGKNLIVGNLKTNVYNRSSEQIRAQNNIWNTDNSLVREKTLLDRIDNSLVGNIVFLPTINSKISATIHASQPEEKNLQQLAVSKNSKLLSSFASRKVDQMDEPYKTTGKNSSDPQAYMSSLIKHGRTKWTEKQVQIKRNSPKPNASEKTLYMASGKSNLDLEVLNKVKQNARIDLNQKSTEKITIKEPVLEALLDSGSREYLERAKPKYPHHYYRNQKEGKVWIEVTVARDGTIDNFQVLKSDGELFTDEAVKALKEFRYKPGFYQKKPVQFTAIEPFIFRIQN